MVGIRRRVERRDEREESGVFLGSNMIYYFITCFDNLIGFIPCSVCFI